MGRNIIQYELMATYSVAFTPVRGNLSLQMTLQLHPSTFRDVQKKENLRFVSEH
jgi:hypothetical protein